MEFERGGTRYSFTFGFFTVLALWLLCDRSGLGLPALGGVLVHEGGHILVMRLTGARILAMRFCAVGVRLEKRGLLPYGREEAVYLGGVAANLLAAGVSVLLCGWNGFAAVNLALCVFNLRPAGWTAGSCSGSPSAARGSPNGPRSGGSSPGSWCSRPSSRRPSCCCRAATIRCF